jgi:hypothetical protein
VSADELAADVELDGRTTALRVELSDQAIAQVKELIAAVRPPTPAKRSLRPSILVIVSALLVAYLLYALLQRARTSTQLFVVTDLEQAEVRMTDARWSIAQARAGTLEVSQASGGRAQVDLPLPLDQCSRLADALRSEHRDCDRGVVGQLAPVTMEWSVPPLVTAPGSPSASRVSVAVIDGSESGARTIRVDATQDAPEPRLCFHGSPGAKLSIEGNGGGFTATVEPGRAGIACDEGLHLLIGDTVPGGAPPAFVLRDVTTMSLLGTTDDLAVSGFAGVVDLGTVGSSTIAAPSSLHIDANDEIDVRLEADADGVHLTMTGRAVHSVVTERGTNLIPTWWERSRAVMWPVVTGLVGAALAAFLVVLNVLTERFGTPRQPTRAGQTPSKRTAR